MLYIRDLSAYFVIGGNGNNKNGLRTIAEFKNGVWREAGQLLTTHNVSFNLFFCFINWFKGLDAEWTNGNLIVAGGAEEARRSESCTLNSNGKFTCSTISPDLTYYYYGVSFLVPSNFCVWDYFLCNIQPFQCVNKSDTFLKVSFIRIRHFVQFWAIRRHQLLCAIFALITPFQSVNKL